MLRTCSQEPTLSTVYVRKFTCIFWKKLGIQSRVVLCQCKSFFAETIEALRPQITRRGSMIFSGASLLARYGSEIARYHYDYQLWSCFFFCEDLILYEKFHKKESKVFLLQQKYNTGILDKPNVVHFLVSFKEE